MRYFKLLVLVLVSVALFFIFTRLTLAIYDPRSVSNNYFGMHIVDPSDLKEVAKLVNSNGGNWGYVTLVIQKGERDPKRWQKVFDEMRRLQLIPIVRVATAPIGNIWEKPNVDEIDGWVSFLNSLNWVIKNRYVTVGNEPNHAKEWGGQVNPKEYASYLRLFSQKLKASNEDFFIMPAGFDASASNSRVSMDEALYLEKMFEADKDVFKDIDGWASHSYPNPAFAGPGNGYGKGTVRTYDWELTYLKYLGYKPDLPVFITETGWVHDGELETNIGPRIEIAFKDVWGKDSRIVAVTPFIFKYVDAPFDVFSWKRKDGQFYDYYNNVLGLNKPRGEPIQEDKADILTGILPKIATSNSVYNGILFIKNTGQSIWGNGDIKMSTAKGESLTVESMFPESIEPGQIGIFLVKGTYPNLGGNYDINIELLKNEKVFNQQFKTSTNLIPGIPTLGDIVNYVRRAISRWLIKIFP